MHNCESRCGGKQLCYVASAVEEHHHFLVHIAVSIEKTKSNSVNFVSRPCTNCNLIFLLGFDSTCPGPFKIISPITGHQDVGQAFPEAEFLFKSLKQSTKQMLLELANRWLASKRCLSIPLLQLIVIIATRRQLVQHSIEGTPGCFCSSSPLPQTILRGLRVLCEALGDSLANLVQEVLVAMTTSGSNNITTPPVRCKGPQAVNQSKPESQRQSNTQYN